MSKTKVRKLHPLWFEGGPLNGLMASSRLQTGDTTLVFKLKGMVGRYRVRLLTAQWEDISYV